MKLPCPMVRALMLYVVINPAFVPRASAAVAANKLA